MFVEREFRAFYGTSKDEARVIASTRQFQQLERGDFYPCYQDFPGCPPEDFGMGERAAMGKALDKHIEDAHAMPVKINSRQCLDVIGDENCRRFFLEIYGKMRADRGAQGKSISEDAVMRYIRLEFADIDGFRRHLVLPDDLAELPPYCTQVACVGAFSHEIISIEEPYEH